jgi:hypothetical protein
MRSRTFVVAVLAALLGSVVGSIAVGVAAAAGDESDGLNVPRGAVVAFSRTTCPEGWSRFASAHGRVIVGARPAGTVGAVVGVGLGDREVRLHRHSVNIPAFGTSETGDHVHVAMYLSDGDWYSGLGNEMVTWNDGMDGEGSGFYAVGRPSPLSFSVYTDAVGDHEHLVDPPRRVSTKAWNQVPYVQLTYCKKD